MHENTQFSQSIHFSGITLAPFTKITIASCGQTRAHWPQPIHNSGKIYAAMVYHPTFPLPVYILIQNVPVFQLKKHNFSILFYTNFAET